MKLTAEQIEHDMRQAAFVQNHMAFRSLNQQMWQIPLISMSLTGGLWFGVSRVDSYPLFQLALLFLAAAGNLALILVLHRLRFVMGEYLLWIEDNYAPGFVKASGKSWHNGSAVVRSSFQCMLSITAIISIGLLIMTIRDGDLSSSPSIDNDEAASAYYDRYAADLADFYDKLTFEDAHPSLPEIVSAKFNGRILRVLDVGAGTGRDAAWFSRMGHQIVAVEPSSAMREVAKRLHSDLNIDWRDDRLPALAMLHACGEKFDLIVASAVWMHVRPEERPGALRSLLSLLSRDGMLYLTLRLGPEEIDRGIYEVSIAEFRQLADNLGVQVEELERQTDLLGRGHVQWQPLRIQPN